jgi:hypothetical protein
LLPNRTYECPECTSQILAAARYFSRPLSALIGKFEVTPNTHQNSVVLHSNDNQAFCSIDKLALYS